MGVSKLQIKLILEDVSELLVVSSGSLIVSGVTVIATSEPDGRVLCTVLGGAKEIRRARVTIGALGLERRILPSPK
jgi:hypothetical protein